MNSKKDMRSLVESLNENLYMGLSEFIVEADENWMNERRLLGGEDAQDGFKGEEGYEKAIEYFSDYLDTNIVKNKEFVDAFKQLLDNLFHNIPEGQAPLVICYEKNSPRSFALRRWCGEINWVKQFFNDYKSYFLFKNDKDKKLIGADILKKFCGYHNTKLAKSVTKHIADEYEMIIAASLNMAINNSDINVEAYRDALGAAGCKNIERYLDFFTKDENFIRAVINYAKSTKAPDLITNVVCYKKLLNGGGYWVPKTDIVGRDSNDNPIVKITIKKTNGSQLMSGTQKDALNVLQNSINSNEVECKLNKLNDFIDHQIKDDELESKIKRLFNNIDLEIPATNNNEKELEENPNIINAKKFADTLSKLSFGERLSWFLKIISNDVKWGGRDAIRNKICNIIFDSLFKNNESTAVESFLKTLIKLSITGETKFTEPKYLASIPNLMLSFDSKLNKIYTYSIESFIDNFVKWIWGGDKTQREQRIKEVFKFSHKTSDKTYLSFRIIVPKKFNIPNAI